MFGAAPIKMLAKLTRGVFVAIGVLLLAIFVWFAGPYFAFGSWRPLESVTARLILIAAFVGVWLLSRAWKRWKAFRASRKLMSAMAAQPQPATQLPADAQKLRERFEEALATLEKRPGQYALYDLPWYALIGPPGSGKTTALMNSGLRFPLEQRVGRGAVRGVGGTRNCDWWFTDEAIFLDTAGRYTTQDSDPSSDSAGWAEFLTLLREYRPRRPLNGVILTVNAGDLLTNNLTENDVDSARRRLSELTRDLKIDLPVYLMVTKCDMIAGFVEYFDDLDVDGRAQVWGVTFTDEETRSNRCVSLVAGEIEALVTRLNERLLQRIEDLRDERRRTRALAFPQEVALLRDRLANFAEDVFGGTRYQQPPLLRGIYFTSGTQDGTSVDRLLGAMSRRFGLAADAVAAPTGPGKAYFVERLLKDVVIGESGLAGVNRRMEVRRAAIQIGAYAAIALVAAGVLTALTISYASNKAYLTETAAQAAALANLPRLAPNAPLDAVVARFDAVRSVVDAAERYRTSTPVMMRWGLYQGRDVANEASDAYIRELDGTLLPFLAARLRARLLDPSLDSERLFSYLKGYLMLGEPKRLEPDHLTTLMQLELQGSRGVSPAVAQALIQHLRHLLDNAGTLRPLALDQTTIARARSTLRQASLPEIMYGRVKEKFQDDRQRALHLDAVLGVGSEQVFRRSSGASLAEPLPALYTATVFKLVTGPGRADLVKELTQNGWVFGEAPTPENLTRLSVAVSNLYERDYIRFWNELLADLQIAPFATVPEASERLRLLASPTSPLRTLITVIRDQTALAEAPKPAAPASGGFFSSKASGIAGQIDSLTRGAKDTLGIEASTAGAMVAAQFRPVAQMLEGEGGKTPLDDVLKSIAEIQQQLDILGRDVGGASNVAVLSSPALRGLLRTYDQQASGLPVQIRHLIEQIGERSGSILRAGAASELETAYEQSILPACRALVANHYPFGSDPARSISLSDFTRVFGPEGVFDQFFSQNLQDQIDTDRHPWAWRPGSAVTQRALPAQFEHARLLRDVFFQSSKTPALTFTVRLSDLSSGASRFVLSLDGVLFDVGRGPGVQRTFEWPGKVGEAVGTFEGPRYGPEAAFRINGQWALFQLIDEKGDIAQASAASVGAVLKSPYNQVQMVIQPTTGQVNPLASSDWRRFSCES